jgi:hypothetical protein
MFVLPKAKQKRANVITCCIYNVSVIDDCICQMEIDKDGTKTSHVRQDYIDLNLLVRDNEARNSKENLL